MRKIFTAALAAFMIFSANASAAGNKSVKYSEIEEYDYGSTYIWVAADKETGKIIPISSALNGLYAYAGGEIELKKTAAPYFSDITEDGLYIDLEINEMAGRGVLTGFEDNTFRPGENLTRAQMAAVFSRLFEIEPADGTSYFSDVPSDSWYCGYVTALTNEGVFKKDVKFNPEESVTREQLIAMTYRMLTSIDAFKESGEYDFSDYKDYDKVSDFAKEAYNSLLFNGYNIISDFEEHDMMDTADDEYFMIPQNAVTRYDCAEFMYMFIRNFLSNNAPAVKRENAPEAEIPVLDGSTSTYQITDSIYWQYYLNYSNHPDFPKAHSKTSNSYKRLIDGEAEMIFVPDPSEEVKSYADEKGVKLRYIPIANEALIFFTSDKNPCDNITTEQLHDIYVNNAIRNWNEIGASDAELVPYCRNNDSGSHAQMEKFILDGGSINEDISREHTSWIMSSILTDVDQFNKSNDGKYAIGYSLYYYYFANAQILGPVDLKILSINGVEPTEETIASGEYPYSTNYYAVIRDEENPKVEKFAELMQGEFGREIVKMSGFGAVN